MQTTGRVKNRHVISDCLSCVRVKNTDTKCPYFFITLLLIDSFFILCWPGLVNPLELRTKIKNYTFFKKCSMKRKVNVSGFGLLLESSCLFLVCFQRLTLCTILYRYSLYSCLFVLSLIPLPVYSTDIINGLFVREGPFPFTFLAALSADSAHHLLHLSLSVFQPAAVFACLCTQIVNKYLTCLSSPASGSKWNRHI